MSHQLHSWSKEIPAGDVARGRIFPAPDDRTLLRTCLGMPVFFPNQDNRSVLG